MHFSGKLRIQLEFQSLAHCVRTICTVTMAMKIHSMYVVLLPTYLLGTMFKCQTILLLTQLLLCFSTCSIYYLLN